MNPMLFRLLKILLGAFFGLIVTLLFFIVFFGDLNYEVGIPYILIGALLGLVLTVFITKK